MTGKGKLRSLVEEAKKTRQNAYSPYSGVKIGAAVLTSDGKIFSGANVENASYGLACCAERTAIFKAVSEGSRDIVAMAVVGKSEDFTKPCGACRQVMVEFNPKMKVLRRGLDGFAEDGTAASLLPSHFKPPELSEK
ncbi:MAG TPA: cytidine deaminase [Nitrososphaerales archaeon]|nr:cytidine deaminase [Nitrososphaerales archaeon]